MKRTLLALFASLFVLQTTTASGQTAERGLIAKQNPGPEQQNDRLLAARAIELLQTLESQVIAYESLGDFQDSGKLAHVSVDAFKRDLAKVSAEVKNLLLQLPPSRLRNNIRNALYSYQDGAFWWERIAPTRVVNVSHLVAPETNRTREETHFSTTIPYTVAINWRNAGKYLKRAEKLLE